MNESIESLKARIQQGGTGSGRVHPDQFEGRDPIAIQQDLLDAGIGAEILFTSTATDEGIVIEWKPW